MRPYEVMVILDAALEDDAIRAQLDKATQIVNNNGGTVSRVERWGKRRFAYEVKHRWEGYYALIEATSEPQAMAELDRALHLADEVIRHKVIRLPDTVAGRAPRPAPSADTGAASAAAATRSEQ